MDYRDLVASLKRTKKVGKIFPFSKGLFKYILSVALEAQRTSARALQVFLLFPLPLALREFSFN
jgi:hypothetical protein